MFSGNHLIVQVLADAEQAAEFEGLAQETMTEWQFYTLTTVLKVQLRHTHTHKHKHTRIDAL